MKNKNRQNRRKPVKQKRSFAGLLGWLKKTVFALCFLTGVSTVTYFGLAVADQAARKPVAKVDFQGELVYLQEQEVRQLLDGLVGKSFLQGQLAVLQQKLLQNPWLQKVSLTRQWPDTLVVELVEQKPIARWGDQGFMNNQGEIVRVPNPERLLHLPALAGKESETFELIRQYRLLSAVFRPLGLSIKDLEKDDLGKWQLTLDNQWRLILGRDQIVDKSRYLVAALQQQILLKNDAIKSIDLRYENGFALQWDKTYFSAIGADGMKKTSAL